jgi:BASS family bile acid:Na+ symporter
MLNAILPWLGWLTAASLVLAVAAGLDRRGRTFAFGLWVLACVLAALWRPELFRQYGPVQAKQLISPLIQIAMFGMGATLEIRDFTRVMRMPKAILAGVGLQFAVMPLLGYLITLLLDLPLEVAAGVILVGCCPGGVSSNVITYLARGHVALSVTLTACSTLLSPFLTPLLMQFYAGKLISVPVGGMMLSILQMVIVPVVLGLLANRVLQRFGVRRHLLERPLSWISMAAICLICAIIAAESRELLLTTGPLLLLAVILHNCLGYLLGYAGAWGLGLGEVECRTIAIEVGLQNGGMAAGLATTVLQSNAAALAPAVFAPWMNLTGSLLAAFWRTRLPAPDRLAAKDLAGPAGLERDR